MSTRCRAVSPRASDCVVSSCTDSFSLPVVREKGACTGPADSLSCVRAKQLQVDSPHPSSIPLVLPSSTDYQHELFSPHHKLSASRPIAIQRPVTHSLPPVNNNSDRPSADPSPPISIVLENENSMALIDTGFPSNSTKDWNCFARPNNDDVFVDCDVVSVLNDEMINKTFCCSFLHWNVNGLLSKIADEEFVTYVSSFDFVCLVETFVDEFQPDIFPEHKLFIKPALKLSHQGRRSGGVICLIKHKLMPFVKESPIDNRNALAFILDKTLFHLTLDILFVCAYVHPENSPFYTYFDINNGINHLEECIIDVLLEKEEMHTLVCGDLNSRISDIVPVRLDDDNDDNYVNYEFDNSLHDSHSVNANRHSEDSVISSYGKCLINMCTALNLCVMNGVCNGDLQGRFTFISDAGNSVVDYFLISKELLSLTYSDCSLNVSESILSDHLPIECCLNSSNVNYFSQDKDDSSSNVIEKYVWKEDKAQHFIDMVNSDMSRDTFSHAIQLIDYDVDVALEMFSECLKKQAECMKQKVNLNRFKKKEWFDEECRNNRRNVRKLLRKFRKTKLKSDSVAYCISRREYKNLLYRKKKQYNESILEQLMSTVNDQQNFWKTLRKVSSKSNPPNNVTMSQWFAHFKDLLDRNVVDDVEDDTADGFFVLDRPITKEEVELAMQKLKNKKAAGPDGVIGEMIKNGGNQVIDFFVKLCNVLFDKGIFPDCWSQSLILPLFKKGSASDPNNYRGITLSNISSKIYSAIVNSRLQEWVTENNLTGEHQAGFKKGYSTIDHMFTLLAIVQKQFSLNRKLYIAFIDFEKAFDSISRNLLWVILKKNGIHGKMYKCIRSMYNQVKVRVKNGGKLTDLINCTRGVKQGDICSPILFSIFINELANEIINNGKHGAILSPEIIEIFILLLADDIALISETPVGLQNQLTHLQRAAADLHLKVNLDKSNIVVFRKGGYLGSCERWFLRGE